jgi:hypothetical protein
MKREAAGTIQHGGEVREYYLDEIGRPRWMKNDKPVRPMTWELHENAGRPTKILGREAETIWRTLETAPEEQNTSRKRYK